MTDEELRDKYSPARPFLPPPPPDRIYRNYHLIRRYTIVKALMSHNTLTGDLLKLELAWRGFKRAVRNAFPVLKRIKKYLK